MNQCSNLYLLSTLACKLAECLDKDDLQILAADLTTLGDMINSILARQATLEDS